MRPDLEVDTAAVRRCAADVADTGARLAAGAARAPAAVAVPRWSASEAAGTLADALAERLVGLGSDVTGTARQMSATADAYEAADDRAAARLAAHR
ncbi:hypothetical protein [Jidongwangia harbinensis]|uniref:hypothetical protein n=1 Tax=Jidongwangia harbinensis TaxID=2878561 RepID=UPI001CD9EAD1|nr:hypothetical protein [Jidongwangia harbinensis]MCA2218627.1 hypothetical protein [Jidongwangia harbinensis]